MNPSKGMRHKGSFIAKDAQDLALKLKGWDQLPSEADKPTKIIFSWKGDEPEWFPKESSTD